MSTTESWTILALKQRRKRATTFLLVRSPSLGHPSSSWCPSSQSSQERQSSPAPLFNTSIVVSACSFSVSHRRNPWHSSTQTRSNLRWSCSSICRPSTKLRFSCVIVTNSFGPRQTGCFGSMVQVSNPPLSWSLALVMLARFQYALHPWFMTKFSASASNLYSSPPGTTINVGREGWASSSCVWVAWRSHYRVAAIVPSSRMGGSLPHPTPVANDATARGFALPVQHPQDAGPLMRLQDLGRMARGPRRR